MHTITSPITYLSVLLDVPPVEADAAFDRCRNDLMTRGVRGRRTIVLGVARLELRGGTRRCEPPTPSAAWPLRVVEGTLRSLGAVWRIPIELQLVPWSQQKTELGLRPTRRWPPHLLVAEPYYVYGRVVLERLGAEIEEWALAARAPTARSERLAG